jgi:hypothetical protein
VSGFAGISREQLRAQYVDAWRKGREGLPLSPLEAMICDVVALHGEYHVLLEDAERAAGFEPDAAQAAQNPFLHMGLHLAIREQISIDRPAGIRETAGRLRARFGDHQGEHALMQVLGETLWEAQRSGRAPDERDYLLRARRLLEG